MRLMSRSSLSSALPSSVRCALVAMAALCAVSPLTAQDTRTVTEPVFPTVCTTLAAQQAIVTATNEPTSETTFDTSRIQTAMNACGAGKAVELTTSGANNAFLIAPLTIPNGVTLVVDAGVTVFASRNPADYQVGGAVETCGTVGTAGNGCTPLFNVNNGSTSTGAGIMGYGIINGRGGDKLLVNGIASTNSWWDIATQANTGSNSQNNPLMMLIKKASNFTLYKITLMNSPMFHVKWQNASGFTAWGVKIITPYTARNTDGIDPGDNVSNVSIINSYLSDGDDNVAVGATTGNPATKISITNMHTYSGHGISIGSYTAGGVSNMAVTNLYMAGNISDSNATGLRIKSAQDRGGLINNIVYKNVCIQNERYPIQFNPAYNSNSGTSYPTFSNIVLRNVTVTTTGQFQLQGLDAAHPLGITFDNLVFTATPTLTPAPKYANIMLGPGPVTPNSLQTINGTGVTYTGVITNPTQARFACSAASYPFLAGELFLSTSTLTNQRTLSLSNPASFTLNAVVEAVEAGSTKPTANIQFYEGTTQVGTAALSGNGTLASVTLNGVTSGSHTYTARYPADGNYLVLNFGSVIVNVDTISTTTTMTATPSSALYGANVALVATVTQASGTVIPGGTVTFTDGTTPFGTATLDNTGKATLNTTTLPVGVNQLYATYAGSSNFAASDSSATPVSVTISQAGSTTTLNASPTTAAYGSTITLTATVASSTSGPPSGTVTFADASGVLGTVTLTPGTNTSTAVLALSTLNAGIHAITATYGGDTNYGGSASSSSSVTVFTQTTTTALGYTTSTSPYGAAVTMIATINGGGNTAITGTVTFSEGGTTIGTGTVTNGVATYTTSSLAIGVHNIVATYGGNGNFTGSSSGAVPLTITQAASSTTIAASTTTPTYGTSVTVTATISTTTGVPPTGTVSFMEGTTVLAGNVVITSAGGVNKAVFSTSTLAGGSHSIFAVYSGDTNVTGSTSTNITITVALVATTTTLAPPVAITYGSSASLSATVTSAVAGTQTGTIQFFDGTTSLGTATLTAGAASLSAPNLAAGTHSITAKYSGDGNFATSTSAAQTLTVNKASSTTTGVASPATITYGTSTTLSASVSPNTVTGNVTFKEGAATVGIANVASGAASFSLSTLSTGVHTLTATYNGDTNYNASTSATFTVTVNQAASTTTLVATPTNPTFLTSVNLTATVPTGATGTVTFTDGTTTIGTGSVSVNGSVTTATFATSSLTGGAHSIAASYGGDVNFLPSTSLAQVVTVSTAATTTTLSAPGSAVFGSSVTLTATVTPNAATAETGTVTFKDGGTTLGTGTLSTTGGMTTATYTTSALLGGSHTLSASYGGDTNFSASTSATGNLTVTQVATSTTLTASPTTTTYGTNIVFTATVAPGASTPETGAVVFKDGAVTLGTGTLSTSGGVTTASFSTSALNGGNHSITATYGGDTNYAGSTSAALAITVNPAATTTMVVANPSTTTYGTSVTFTATLSTTAASGTVTFKDGAATIGSGNVSGGVASFSLSTLSTATHSITAVYAGDNNFAASTSAAITVTVNPVTPTVALAANPSTITYGGSTTLTATLTPAVATGSVTFRDLSTGATLGLANLSGGVASVIAAGLGGGTHVLQASYSGDTNDSPASSPTITLTVNPVATATALTVNPTTTTYGTSETFSSQVTPATATGTVRFTNGSTTLGVATLVNGVASFSSSTLVAGSYSVVAMYSGDANDAASTSSAVALSIGKATVTAVLAAAPTASTYGTSVTFTTTLSSTATTGTATFSDGGTAIGTGAVTNGVASFSTTTLTGGTHTLSAAYSGDGNFNAASTSSIMFVVSVANSATAISLSPTTVVFNSSGSATATISPTATGTVTFRDGPLAVATATVSGGTATANLPKLSGASHSITAVYSGDTNVGGSTSAPATLTVTPLAIPFALASSTGTSAYGGSITFTAALNSPSSTAPTGTVTFLDGATPFASAAVNTQQAVVSFANLTPGTHSITANYSGDSNYAAATTSPVSITITSAGSTTTLTSTPPQATPGATFTLNASALATSAAAGANMPTGTITFSDSTGNLATVTLVNGAASLARSLIPLGNHTYTATYSGDANYSVSSASTTVAIKQLGSTTSIGATPTSGVYGGVTYSFTSTVTPAPGGPALTGTVTFNDVTTVPSSTLGTVTLSGGAAALSGIALPGGTRRIVAVYSGDVTYTASDTTAAPAIITVATAATSTTLTASPTIITAGNPLTLTSNSTSSAAGTLTGTVSFYEGTTLLRTLAYSSAGVSITLTNVNVGNHSYTAVYSGDTNYSASTSGAASVTSNAISQTITVTGVPASLTYGAAPFVISATASSGLPVTINVSGPASVIGSTFTVTGAGTITITASQSGDSTHSAAPNVMSTVIVAKAPLTVTTNNATSAPGQPIPPFSGSVAGIVNNDNITATYSTTANQASPAGTYPITATLSDPNNRLVNYAVSNPGGTLTIVAYTQTITFPAIQTRAVYGASPITLAATASSNLPITYTVSGPGTISGSTLVITGAGSITVTATQPGNGTYSAATPVSQSVAVSRATLNVTVASATRAFGTANPTFTGTVTGVVGTDGITASYATTATVNSAPGSYAITATLADPNNRLTNYNVTNTPGTLTISMTATTVSISASPTTATFGSAVMLTVSVTGNAGGTPTGTMTFKDGTSTIGTATLANGVATLSTAALAVGVHALSASYGGDANFSATSTATAANVTITQAASATVLAAQPVSAAFGSPIVLTATVSNSTTTAASGIVTFKDGTTTLGTGTLTNGVAMLTVSTLSGGSHTLTASYAGDTNFTASASGAVTVNITTAAAAITLVSSASTATLGTSLTFTATVTGATGTPTGTVTFSDGTTTLGTVTLTVTGQASYSTSALAVGTHVITACYSGDSNFAPTCFTAGVSVHITAANAATTLTVTPSSVAFGQSLTFTAKVPTSLSTVPTGTITLRTSSSSLGTATLANVSGVATAVIVVNSTVTGIGTFPAVASYGGDTNFTASDSSATPLSFTVTGASTTTTLAMSAPQIAAQGSVTFTGTVTSATGTPSGTVQFLSGAAVITSGTLNASGVATATVSTLGVGSYTITALYVASGNYLGSTSAAQTLSVVAPVTTVASPTSFTLAPGASGTATITITPVLGYTGPVTLTCSSPVAYITCTASAPTAISGIAPTTGTVTIKVAASVAAMHPPSPLHPQGDRIALAALFPLAGLLLLPFALSRRRGLRSVVRLMAAVLLLSGASLAMNGCGSGYLINLPPVGTQTVTVTATAAGTSVSTPISVTITH